MANRFWVGGTATWDGTAGSKWSTTSGGAGGSAAPTAADDVFFDSNSTGTCTTASVVCRSLDFNGFTGTLSHPASTTITIGDGTAGAGNRALRMSSGMTYTRGSATTSIFSFVSTSTTSQVIDLAGKTIGNVTFNGSGAVWSITSAFQNATTSTVTVTTGSVDFGGASGLFHDMGFLVSTGSFTRSILLGDCDMTLRGSGSVISFTATGLTFNAGTSTIHAVSTSGLTLAPNTNTLYNLHIGTGTVAAVFNSVPTIANNFTIDGPRTVTFAANATKTINGAMILNSSSGNVITFQSGTAGTAFTLALPSGVHSYDYLSLKDSSVTGGTTYAGTHSTNVSGNTGWIFTAPSSGYSGYLFMMSTG